MIYADFEGILVPRDNEKQNQNKSKIKNKYQKHGACICGYKLVCVGDKFSKPFKLHLGENTVYNFINSMVEESKYCSDMTKKHFNKKVAMTKKNNEDFKNSTKCWIWDNDYVDGYVKIRDHCHVTGKYKGSAHSYCNTKLN